MKIVCAGQSPRGMEFGATYGNYNFTWGKGVNHAYGACADQRGDGQGRRQDRPRRRQLRADDGDRRRDRRGRHGQVEALQTKAPTWGHSPGWRAKPNADPNAARRRNRQADPLAPEGAINFNMGTLVLLLCHGGPPARRMRPPCPPPRAIMLTFDDFLIGMEQFGQAHPAR